MTAISQTPTSGQEREEGNRHVPSSGCMSTDRSVGMSGNVDTSGAVGNEDLGDSEPIRALRAQVKELKAKLKDSDPELIRAQVLAEANRSNTAASLMDNAGFPKLGDLFATQVEGELNAEAATEFLSGLGLAPQTPSDDPAPQATSPVVGGLTTAQVAAEVERLAALGAEAGSVGQTDVPIDELIKNARTSADVTKIMRDANLTVKGH